MGPVAWDSVSDYVRSLGIDAWLVGGAVRDELLGKSVKDADFVVPGVGQGELRDLLAPPRVERSTGPGRHDFEIVADASIPLEEDMRRRDFTINAIAKNLRTGELLDPLGGRDDLRAKTLRVTSATSFRDDPLRIVRGLRFVSQLDVDPDEETRRQMHEWAPQIAHVSAE